MIRKIIVIVLSVTCFFSCSKKAISMENKIEAEKSTKSNYLKNVNDNKISEDFNITTEISENDIRPEEFDIANDNEIDIEDWYSKQISEDGKYYCYENREDNSTYNRYCIPIEGDRKDLTLIMLKKDCYMINPNDLGTTDVYDCNLGCEFVPLARSEKPITYKGEVSYWFKINNNKWIPGVAVYIQTGAFDKLPIEKLEIGLDYEEIEGGKWFTVNTDDGSSLRLRDSSNVKNGKVITSLPSGTWVYAESQTISNEKIDDRESHWYKIVYPETGYIFGGYLESKEGIAGLEFAVAAPFYYGYDSSKDSIYKIYSAPTKESECLGEYEIKPDGNFYSFTIRTKDMEIIDGKEGEWVLVNEPVRGFIFGDRFIYK